MLGDQGTVAGAESSREGRDPEQRGRGRAAPGGLGQRGGAAAGCAAHAPPAHAVPAPSPSSAEEKSTGSILDDIGSMFDDLADQLDAMLE